MWREVRELFPIHAECVYLNNAGVAPPSVRVLDALEAYHRTHARSGWRGVARAYGDTSSRIKEILGELLACPPSSLALTHNTSEGMNLIAQGLAWKPGDTILGLEREYPANVYPWWNLERKGVRHRRIPPTESADDVALLARHLDGSVRLVAVSAVDWCSGRSLDLAALEEVCRRAGVLLAVDVAQALGVVPLDRPKAGGMAMAGSAWKWLMGPIGLGVFYCPPDLLERLELVFVGTDTVVDAENYLDYRLQPKPDTSRFEFSTPNVNDWVYLLASLSLLREVGFASVRERIRSLTAQLREGLAQMGFRIRGPESSEGTSGIVSFWPEDLDARRVVAHLARQGIVTAERDGAVRASPHIYTSEEDIDRLLTALATLPGEGPTDEK